MSEPADKPKPVPAHELKPAQQQPRRRRLRLLVHSSPYPPGTILDALSVRAAEELVSKGQAEWVTGEGE